MRVLYIVPKIKSAGGVARVLNIKANYFVEKFGYEVHILSQNEENTEPFYAFNPRIIFHNMNLEGNVFRFFFSFQETVNQIIKNISPDVVLVADNGLKAFTYPFILKTKTPIVLEVHGSKYVEEKAPEKSILLKLKYAFKDFAAEKFIKVVTLSNESLKEWNVKNAVVIPNPSWLESNSKAELQSKKAIAIARNSYEKGLDRLLVIWKQINQKYPNWTLDIYTDDVVSLEKKALDFGITSGINCLNFVKNLEEKYLEASVLLMTSRTEGFGMVLLEAMTLGLPCVAYDCPIGPRTMIKEGHNGFLIPDGNVEMFVEKTIFLIENKDQRLRFGSNAKETAKQFSVEKIMKQWKLFLENLLLH